MPIEFDANYPFLQVQPVHRSVYGDALDGFEIVERIEDLTPSDWDDFHKTVSKPMADPHRPRGEYAVQSRKRRQDEENQLLVATCAGLGIWAGHVCICC